MIGLHRVSKQYGKQLLFVDASFQRDPGENVGLVGPYGSGKTTLFRMLAGETPDDGPDVLLMDEPMNHLDIESIVWLERFLTNTPGALLMTSHDRDFMHRVVTRVADIDDGEITSYSGNDDFYERERGLRAANREAAFARHGLPAARVSGLI